MSILTPRGASSLVALFLTAPLAAAEPTLETIMSRDFVGTAPENPAWSEDGRSIYYERRRPGTDIRDLHRVELASGRTTVVPAAERGRVDAAAGAVESRDRRLKAFVRDGDLYAFDRRRGSLRQLTRTSEAETDPLPLEGGRRVAFRRGDDFYAYDLDSGVVATVADLRFADDPDAKKEDEPWVGEQEERLFAVLAERDARRDAAREERRQRCATDTSCAPEPWFLGAKRQLLAAALSPDGARLAVVVGPERDLSEEQEQGADGGKSDRMAVFVNDSGYVEMRDVRPKVGTGKPQSPHLLLLDLATRARHELDYDDALPGLAEDPLAELRAQAAKPPAAAGDPAAPADANETPKPPTPRVVSVESLVWNDDGSRLAVQFFSYDNKDRWIAQRRRARPGRPAGRAARADAATRPGSATGFAELGWMRDGATLWYLSEESGCVAPLRCSPPGGARRALTRARSRSTIRVLSRDGRSFLVAANREHPGVYEALPRRRRHRRHRAPHRARRADAPRSASPDERRLLLTSSEIDLAARAVRAGGARRRAARAG